ncbi:hypothetical protein H9X85_00415 [Anaerotignum lactatifermentans]|uniref:SGNH hydrolase-type esterase domain-containing protein n=1 Tax=Anaerotignum lactatifermentans TaxID=160404 RepID=A0ABS2G840_9FIRM|nr:GDSL-type esterase/lipase family protein [Anaerotignum lactatifermentans]MBM6828090.1 hypothetical protein [Anaerotignum lactatifermentans]MBM6876747.1 hypothetical protein [Anaerotignum lactatifermentans]MBM6949673.1 hypothetical protein [Anaerotignum lactatifermentans]
MENKKITIVGFGDSLTYGYGVLEDVAYPYRLSMDLPQIFPQIQWDIINSGINGQTTREGLHRLPMSVLKRKPQIVLILFGSNDSALNEGQYRTPYEYEKNLRQIIESILSLSTGNPVFSGRSIPVLMTPPSMVDTDFYPFTTNDRLEHFGEIVKKLAAEYGLPLIDLFSAYQEIKEKADYEACFQYDGIHLSPRGYDILYRLVLTEIKHILTKTKEV